MPYINRILKFALMCLMANANSRAETGSETNRSLTPQQRLEPRHLQAEKEDRLRFARERRPTPSHGLYEDFRAEVSEGGLWFATHGPDGKPISGGGKRLPGLQSVLLQNTNFNECEINQSNRVVHVWAQELTESLIRGALTNGHSYVADDRLCDPTGFSFGAVNNLGLFTAGDTAPMLSKTRIVAITPLNAKLRLIHEDAMARETTGTNLIFEAKEPGAYRLEARLTVDGEDVPWICSGPIYLKPPSLADMRLPSMEISPEVETRKNISYREGPEEDAAKHRLDVYVPRGKTNAPVFFFIHGGAWKTGDRSYYPPLGNRYARAGYVTVIPSYRLAPKHPHPAQIEDVAAAFAWTVRHVAENGGDTNRIYVAGHSAGGHLAALLALDKLYLAAFELSPNNIRGVLALSGVYDLSVGDFQESVFGKSSEGRREASPQFYIKPGAPPFLVEFCEWDYFTLPGQARAFHHALREAGVKAELVYIPGQSHISEMLSVASDNDPIVTAALKFMK
jgi:acetyl esterase/lipase